MLVPGFACCHPYVCVFIYSTPSTVYSADIIGTVNGRGTMLLF